MKRAQTISPHWDPYHPSVPFVDLEPCATTSVNELDDITYFNRTWRSLRLKLEGARPSEGVAATTEEGPTWEKLIDFEEWSGGRNVREWQFSTIWPQLWQHLNFRAINKLMTMKLTILSKERSIGIVRISGCKNNFRLQWGDYAKSLFFKQNLLDCYIQGR